MTPAKILIIYPSRGRPVKFFEGLDSIYQNLHDTDNFHISCTLDEDDPSMNNKEVENRILSLKNTSIEWGLSDSKIHAINRGMPDEEGDIYYDWDIVVVFSDDMRVCLYGFDQIIRNEMSFGFPDGDGYLHFWEKDSKEAVNVMSIMDKKYYNRFGWIYHPEYQSLWVDNEQTETAKLLGRYKFFDCEIIKHLNPAYNYPGTEKDSMFLRQQEIGWTADQETYLRRKANNFDL